LKRKFIVKVGDKTFPVEVEELQEGVEPVPQVPRPAAVEAKAATAEPVRVAEQRVEAVAGAIRAPLPGKVLSVKCKVGDSVNAGDTVLILESMKMENAIMAPKSGRVKEVLVAEGATVALGDVLIVIE
jgi:biotin carboxyl carrier protein